MASDIDSSAEVQTMTADGAAGGVPAAKPRTLSRSILELAAGRGAVTAVSLCSMPILSRMYDPGDFGILAILTNIVSALAACTSFSYVTAMPLATTISDRRALFVLSGLIGLAGTAALTVGALVGADWLAAVFGEPLLADCAIAVPLLFLATALSVLINTVSSCSRHFGKVNARNIVATLGTRVLQIAAALVGLARSPGGLLWGAIGGEYLGSFCLSFTAVRSLFRESEVPFRFAQVKAVAVQFRRFPLVNTWSVLLNSFALTAPVFVMGVLFSNDVVGQFSMALTLVALPVQLFSVAGAQVYYVDAADAVARGRSAAGVTAEMFELLVVLTAFPLCVVMVAGPALCAVVLGAPWREAGVYAQLLVPWVVMMALASPLYAILLATQRLAETLAYNVVLLAARVAALLVGGLLGGPRSAVALYVVVSVVLVGWTVARTLFVAEVSRRWAARLMIRSYGESLLLLLPAGLLSFYGRPVWAMGALGLASVAEIVILWVRFPRARNVVRVMVVRARAPFTAQGSAK